MIVVKPPSPLPPTDKVSIFLAGSIEMGTAVEWQAEVAHQFSEFDLYLLNPRRDAWDSTWVQDIKNPMFKGQVKWELAGLKQADMIMMHFDPATKSPITLLELGLFANSGKLFVSCPPKFYRKGNVDIVCEENNIALFPSLDSMIFAVKKLLPLWTARYSVVTQPYDSDEYPTT